MKLSRIMAMKGFWKRVDLFLLGALKFILLVLTVALGLYLAIAFILYLVTGDSLSLSEIFKEAAGKNSNVGRILPLALSVITIVSGIVGLCLLYLRLKNQGRALDHQMAKEVDDRFIAAVGLLGNAEASARTGAIYSLYQLFIDKDGKKYRRQIAQILCSHIRTKTQEKKYQKKHKDRPSNEIQTAINLLFRNIDGDEGIYCMSEIVKQEKIPPSDLQYAFLCGANFGKARCEKSNFQHTYCAGAYFEKAYCVGANFRDAHCEGANFQNTHCEGVQFEGAHCEGGAFGRSHCEGANFHFAYCMSASFWRAHCEGACFVSSHCENSNFSRAHCEGACFAYAHCQDASFEDADFRGSSAPKYIPADSFGMGGIKGRIGKETELENMIFAGELNEKAIQVMDEARPYIIEFAYNYLQKIIEKNKGVPHDYTVPQGMITGVLEDSPELQKIIQKLEKIEKGERRKADAPL